MRRPSLLAVLLLPLALGVALPLAAGQVYTWKDTKGVTHYADAPPAGRKSTSRTIGERRPAPVAAKVAVNSDCSNARGNLNLLQGQGKVGIDEDKDGKPDRELTAAERASRLKVAEGEVELYCSQPIANAATVKQG